MHCPPALKKQLLLAAWINAKKDLDVPSPLREDIVYDELGPALPHSFILSTDTFGTEFEFVGSEVRNYFGPQLCEGQKLHAVFSEGSWDNLAMVLKSVVHLQQKGTARIIMPFDTEQRYLDMYFLPMRHGADGEINRILGAVLPTEPDEIPAYRVPGKKPIVVGVEAEKNLSEPEEALSGPPHFLETGPEVKPAFAISRERGEGPRRTPFMVVDGGLKKAPSPARQRVQTFLEEHIGLN